MTVYKLRGADDKIRRVISKYGLDVHSRHGSDVNVWVDDEEVDDVENYAEALGVVMEEV